MSAILEPLALEPQAHMWPSVLVNILLCSLCALRMCILCACFPLIANSLPLSTPRWPLRFVTTAPVSSLSLSFPASNFHNRRFWFILLFTIVFNFWQLGIDIFWWISMSYNSNTFLNWSDPVSSICKSIQKRYRNCRNFLGRKLFGLITCGPQLLLSILRTLTRVASEFSQKRIVIKQQSG